LKKLNWKLMIKLYILINYCWNFNEWW